jgi:flagellar motor switch protein FliN
VDAAALADYAEVPPAALSGGTGETGRGLLLLDGETHKASLAFVAPVTAPAPTVSGHDFEPVPAPAPAGNGATRLVPSGPIELLGDVEMGVTVELGRTRMLVRDILDLSPGSVIELDRAAGAPIDVLVNGTLIARGEVVVIDEEFGIRITEVIGYEDGARPGGR